MEEETKTKRNKGVNNKQRVSKKIVQETNRNKNKKGREREKRGKGGR